MKEGKIETATLAGGCFWCTEAIFKRLKGVISVESGYAGAPPVEAVQIKFDPKILPFEHMLEIFWAVHDPTTLNRQGPDVGTQYRSAIFYHDDKQKEIAQKSKPENAVTQIPPFEKFYTAEEYHQNYYERNRYSNAYCTLVIDPKIEKLLAKFGREVKDEYK